MYVLVAIQGAVPAQNDRKAPTFDLDDLQEAKTAEIITTTPAAAAASAAVR